VVKYERSGLTFNDELRIDKMLAITNQQEKLLLASGDKSFDTLTHVISAFGEMTENTETGKHEFVLEKGEVPGDNNRTFAAQIECDDIEVLGCSGAIFANVIERPITFVPTDACDYGDEQIEACSKVIDASLTCVEGSGIS